MTVALPAAGPSSEEQDAEACGLQPGALHWYGRGHLTLHQPGHRGVHVLWEVHRGQHHPQPPQLLVSYQPPEC